jgi:mannose-1-phosphate guanylyltransferase
MIALPADHFVSNIDGYVKTLQLGIENLQEASGIVFGISPARPETGYGYVLTDASSSVSGALNVIRFVEKPNAEKAAEFLASGDYYWNSGMFLWKNSTLLDLFRQHMPEFYGSMCILRSLLGTDSGAEINKVFSSLPRISIDFGIMEKTAGLKLVPAQFIWDDIGNWASLERALPADSQGNIAQGSHIALESSRCILYAQSETIAAFGVTDLVIVQAYGQVLVCPKSKTGDLKRLVSALAARIL